MRITKGRAAATAMAAAALLSLAPAAPASAATPDRWGFAFVKDPTPTVWTPLDPAYQYGSWKTFAPAALADGIKVATGRFLVRFPLVAAGARGIPHVTAVSSDGRFCEAVRWNSSGADEIVDVACFRPGGPPIDSPFTVLWTLSSGVTGPGAYASVQVNPPGVAVQQYNSTGLGVVTTPTGVPGVYQVIFRGVGQPGNVQVTAVQPNALPRRCKVLRLSWSGADVFAIVSCYNPATGFTISSDFTASFHRERSVYAAVNPPRLYGYVANPVLGAPTNFNSITGVGGNSIGGLSVKFPYLHQKETHAQVTAFGDGPAYCNLRDLWIDAGGTALVNVACFTNTGAAINNGYLAAFSSSI